MFAWMTVVSSKLCPILPLLPTQRKSDHVFPLLTPSCGSHVNQSKRRGPDSGLQVLRGCPHLAPWRSLPAPGPFHLLFPQPGFSSQREPPGSSLPSLRSVLRWELSRSSRDHHVEINEQDPSLAFFALLLSVASSPTDMWNCTFYIL